MNAKPVAAASLAALLCSACLSNPPTPLPQRLALPPPATAAAKQVGPAAPRLVLRAVQLPGYLDDLSIVQRSSAQEITAYRGAEWAERPRNAITRYLAASIQAQRNDWTVDSLSSSEGSSPDAVLWIDLTQLERDPSGSFVMRGSWRWQHGDQQLSGALTRNGGLVADSPRATVQAMADALTAAAQSIAEQLPRAR